MSRLQPFQPIPGGGAAISATATSSSTAINDDGNALRINNAGANEVFVRLGPGSQTAVVDTDLALLSGQSIIVSKADNPSTSWQLGAICNSAETATVYIQAGYGE